MKNFLTFIFILLVGFALVTSVSGQTAPVIGQITPNPLPSNIDPAEISLTGSGFVSGAIASLSGVGNLTTTFVSQNNLTAQVPAGITPGYYDLTVTNPDGGTATVVSGFAVVGPSVIEPNQVSNGSDVEIAVIGVGFLTGATVVLDNFGALNTTFVSSSLLRAVVPAGTPPLLYPLSVVNPNGTASVLPNALRVTAPAGTPEPTTTPIATAFVRPVLVVQSYGASVPEIIPAENLDFEMTLANGGQSSANNIIVTFVSGDFLPRVTGGVQALGTIQSGQSSRFFQPLTATSGLSSQSIATLEVQVSYTDANGTAYNETFRLTFPVKRSVGNIGPSATPTATATPTPTATATATVGPRIRPQLLVTAYQTDVTQLQPGLRFTLSLNVQNMGQANAQRVSLILGGGSSSGGSLGGTPDSGGGLSGAGGDFSKFAPVGSSNVIFLGDLPVGNQLTAQMGLIVNGTTTPGAYPVKVSFVYNDESGGSYVDDQIITLLVFLPPAVEINFYVEPPPFFVGQSNSLPLQLTNVGRSTAVFSNFTVTAAGGSFFNNTIFVGGLEAGGFFPLDAVFIPDVAGPVDLLITVGYTDDFSQPQLISKTITIEVLEAPIIDPGDGGFPDEGGGEVIEPPIDNGLPETLGQKLWRLILGLLGLSSTRPETTPADMFGPPVDGTFEEVPAGDFAP